MSNQDLNNSNENKSDKNDENNLQIDDNTKKLIKPSKKDISESTKEKKNETHKPRVSYAMALSNGLKIQSKNYIKNKSNLIISPKSICDNKINETNQYLNKTFSHIDSTLDKIISKLKKFESATKTTDADDNSSKPETMEKNKTKSKFEEFNKEKFFEMIKSEFKCSICQEVMVNATNLNCSHTFCRNCISAWLNKNLKCPVCRLSFKNKQHVLPIDNFLNFFYQKFCSDEEAKNRSKLVSEHFSKKKKDKALRQDQQVDSRNFSSTPFSSQLAFRSEHLNSNHNVFNRFDNLLSTNSLPNLNTPNQFTSFRQPSYSENFLQRRFRNNSFNEIGNNSSVDNLSMEVNSSMADQDLNSSEQSRISNFRSLRNLRNSSQSNSIRNNRLKTDARNNFDSFFDLGNISRHRINLKDRTNHRYNNLQRRTPLYRERRMLRRTRRDNFNDFLLDREN